MRFPMTGGVRVCKIDKGRFDFYQRVETSEMPYVRPEPEGQTD